MATKIFGLIGYPLGHSFSRKFFNNKFRNEDIDAEYRNFEIDDISLAGNIFLQSEICGLNVTIPYKQQIIPLLNEVDKDAQAIGSVNVIKFVRKGELVKTIGFNTDIIGFHDSIAPHIRSHHRRSQQSRGSLPTLTRNINRFCLAHIRKRENGLYRPDGADCFLSSNYCQHDTSRDVSQRRRLPRHPLSRNLIKPHLL